MADLGVQRGLGRAGEAVQAGDALVSVILPVRDREGSVRRAIESVLSQTYRPIELIVVDDGSTDGTRAEIERFGSDVRLIAQEGAGAYAARNRGLREARGELIAFMDSDDAWLPGKLAAQVPLMRRPQVGLVFGDTVHVSEAREGAPRTGSTSFGTSPAKRGRVAGLFAWRNFVPTCTVLVRRRCLEEQGGFSEAGTLSADYLAWFRIALRHELDYVDGPLAEYTVHPAGISFDLGKSLAARIALFSAELEEARDETTRRLLRRLLFNLSLHLAAAAIRGRAGSIEHPFRLAWRTARVAGRRATFWAAAFAVSQTALRTRRIFT
jgi:glycosyltransferase involved in cell wall biosynthesis